MRYVPGAAAVCAILSPVLVIAGSLVAAARQPPGYDPVRQSLSALARIGATDRWIMTATLVVIGLAYLMIALALGVGGVPGRARFVLGVAGAGVMLAGVFPQPFSGSSPWHMGSAAVAWIAFTVWPLAVWRRATGPGLLGMRTTLAVTGVLVVLMTWFVVELRSDGALLGLAERVLVVAQTLWPIAVVLACRAQLSRTAAHRAVEPAAADPVTG